MARNYTLERHQNGKCMGCICGIENGRGIWCVRLKKIPTPTEVKRCRNTELLELQSEISQQDNQRFVERTVEILVEGPSKKPHLNCPAQADRHRQLVGRTGGDHIVVINAPAQTIGSIINVKITRASALTLFARPVTC